MDNLQLSSIVEGVEAVVLRGGVRLFRVVVIADMLRENFGADGTPSSWLAAFAQHDRVIEHAAQLRYAEQPKPVVVLYHPRHFQARFDA